MATGGTVRFGTDDWLIVAAWVILVGNMPFNHICKFSGTDGANIRQAIDLDKWLIRDSDFTRVS
jgi:hypothetical protein